MTPFRWAAALTAATAIGVAMVLRYGLMEPQAMNEACWATVAPWWCTLRQGLAALIHYKALGAASLIAGGLALALGWRSFVLGAIVFGGLGLVLYTADLAAIGLIVGGLRSLRA